ncbi:hypothetical protein DS2_08038 [Catenovulum agarivorans DS-2]|uniref:Adenylate cyclase n=1 Tax=Catenovulum agarivorans DS-2 TaxID=1328313 RepID=W7QN80_9ALTE|nr:DUF3095 domain-containing protein [Catenovulum agarivorans]EWH10407.1 hypothetical protein DS2_08038 [Catenovulum agarivorans DS-2]
MQNDLFYQELDQFNLFSEFAEPQHYQPVPNDWFVVITDVVNSTQAIQDGRYRQVNALGVASIVAIMNSIKPLKVPYIFGGDGASVCVPSSVLQQVKQALQATVILAKQQFSLEIRAGVVPVSDIRQLGKDIRVAKFQPKDHFSQAMFDGNGLSAADSLIKQANSQYLIEPVESDSLDNNDLFEGFECRWNEIPSRSKEHIALLVQALPNEQFSSDQIYQIVLMAINGCYGDELAYHPITPKQMSLSSKVADLQNEAKIRSGFVGKLTKYKYIAKLKLLRHVGNYLMKNKVKTDATEWGGYKQRLVENTDFQKFDDMLRMVISGNEEQRVQLENKLKQLQQSGLLAYGIHSAPSALITCMVNDYNHDHVHFLDTTRGGYAMAAKQLKSQLATLKSVE